MLSHNKRRKANANEMLLETAMNLFSEKTQEVRRLLKSNKELFSKEVLDQCLLSCCRGGNLLLMPDIKIAGADLEATDENGNTPLSLCALMSSERCAWFLLRAGAKVNAVNLNGNTPLIVSVGICASIGVTKQLISNKNIRLDQANNDGYTALLCAIESGNLNAIKLLIDAGASLEMNEVVHETLEAVASRKGLLNVVKLFKLHKSTGKSPLLLAALNRDLNSIEIMTNMNASILIPTNDSIANIMIQFLKSIQDNKNVVDQSEMEMFEFLLSRLNVTSQNLSISIYKNVV